MAKFIQTRIIIQAKPDKVWSVLTDFEGYPQWNPFIKSLTGDMAVGNTIQVVVQPPGGKAMTFKPKVLTFETHKSFSWLGRLLFPGLFDGLHSFRLEDNGDGTTTLFHEEKFSGILVSLINLGATEHGFIAMNEKIKSIVENG